MSSGAIHQGLPARRQIKALKEAEKWNQCHTHSGWGAPDIFILMVKKTFKKTFEITVTALPHVSCWKLDSYVMARLHQ